MEGFWMTPADTYRTSVLANASASALVFAADAPLLVRRPSRGPVAARAPRAPLGRVGACIAAVRAAALLRAARCRMCISGLRGVTECELAGAGGVPDSRIGGVSQALQRGICALPLAALCRCPALG